MGSTARPLGSDGPRKKQGVHTTIYFTDCNPPVSKNKGFYCSEPRPQEPCQTTSIRKTSASADASKGNPSYLKTESIKRDHVLLFPPTEPIPLDLPLWDQCVQRAALEVEVRGPNNVPFVGGWPPPPTSRRVGRQLIRL